MSIQLSKTEEEIMHFFWKEEKFYDKIKDSLIYRTTIFPH